MESALRGIFQGAANKLAYLAYTGKVELGVRDELAWVLQKGRESKGSVGGSIGREHNRVDLVAFNESDAPEYLLQCKALYVGDLIPRGRWNSDPHKLLNKLADDFHIKAIDDSNCPAAGLLLVTDIPNPPERPPARLAYDDIVKRQARLPVTQQELHKQLQSLLSKATASKRNSSSLTLHGGGGVWCGTHGGDVRVHWFLVTL